MSPILISNSFPFSLVRRSMQAEPRSVGDLLTAMRERPWVSAWGHDNTVAIASTIACADLRPVTARPALNLDANLLPSLDGQSFEQVWLLSPDYSPGFRPQIGQEVAAEAISGWQLLRLSFELKSNHDDHSTHQRRNSSKRPAHSGPKAEAGDLSGQS